MRKVLLDACVPRRIWKELRTDFVVETSQDISLNDLDDGPLLDAIQGRFDVLVTRDRNLAYQQQIGGRSFSVIVLVAKDQSAASFLSLVPALKVAIVTALPGIVLVVGNSK